MVNTKELIYKKAYTELNEVLKKLSDIELSKIPNQLIENVRTNMDTNYIWKYDDSKKIEDQDFLVETKALIVEIYERYLCPEDKKDFWKKYDQVCLNMIEEKRRQEYNPDNIFSRNKKESVVNEKEVITNEIAMVEYKETIFSKLKEWFRNLFNKKRLN